ncbi:hypothetical protein K457DRAFT_21571 [Linnemannia elongata AG-77]|uniref:Uncharacterized protein n=1 Tax=Linnemannia elongata AG-77 TaxID=1314771 RepID=A0A197JPF6_9FUNG|nr:hypothetical protein K457DRAFT_21571 [Linnemannia elongata AG-77]
MISTALATKTTTKQNLTQKVIFFAGGVALILVGSTLISLTGPAAVIQAFIQAGAAAAAGTTGAATTTGIMASATSAPTVASAMASGTLLVKQFLLGATVTVSSILMLFYCCIYPNMDTEKKGCEEQEGMSIGLKEFLMELVYRLRLCTRPEVGPLPPSPSPNPFRPSTPTPALIPSIPLSFTHEDSLDATTAFITDLLQEMGLGSYDEYSFSGSSPSSPRPFPMALTPSSASITSSSSSSSTSSTGPIWTPAGSFVLDDQNMTTATTFYVERPRPTLASSTSPSSSSSSPSSTAASGLRQRFTF